MPTRTSKTKTLPTKTATGASSSPATVAEIVCPAAPRARPEAFGRQTHGAVTSLSGPITSALQLTKGGRTIAKGAPGSFETLGAYTEYLESLSTYDLHSHAVMEARLTPIDDRARLIRRLETMWTNVASKHPGRAVAMPSRAPFTTEQMAAQEAVRKQVLGR